MFQLLTRSLAGRKAGEFPATIRLRPVYGPVYFPPELGDVVEDLTPASVIQAASLLAGTLGARCGRKEDSCQRGAHVGGSRKQKS